jgi:hypothetical protein
MGQNKNKFRYGYIRTPVNVRFDVTYTIRQQNIYKRGSIMI